MGCKSSTAENPDEIKSNMKWTKIPKFDDFFDKAKSVLEGAETLRSGFADSIDKMHEVAYTRCLKEPVDLTTAVEIFTWALSAGGDGDIQKNQIEVLKYDPYVTVNTGNCHPDCWDFKEALTTYLRTAVTGPETLVNIIKDLADLAEQGSALGNPADAAKEAGLGALDSAKASAATLGNLKLIADGIKKAGSVKTAISEAGENLKKLIPQVQELRSKADVVGKAAANAGHRTLWECCYYHHPAPKKTDKELDDEEKAKEKAKEAKAKGEKGKPADKKEVKK